MKRSVLSAAVALAYSAIVALPAFAADGVINFTGSVTDVTCKVEGTAPGGAAAKYVKLNGIPASKLDTAGKKDQLTGFSIAVGGIGESGCTNGRSAMVAFDPSSPSIDVATGRLNIDAGDDAATNVQIEVTNQSGTAINVYTQKSAPVVIADNQAMINLAAQYYATGAATEGTVAARVGFMIVYAD